jgi:hypothetical protein
MIESIFELLFGLFWSALILFVASSIVGSIVAALRAVSHEITTVNATTENIPPGLSLK